MRAQRPPATQPSWLLGLLCLPSERQEKQEQEQEELEEDELEYLTPKPSDARTSDGDDTESTFTGSSAAAAVQADPCTEDDLAQGSDSGALCGGGKPVQENEIIAEQPVSVEVEEVVKPDQPNFAGTWDLVRTEGDLDKLLTDMGQGWLIRNGAKALKYGVGRVVVECHQDGDELKFSKVLCDPRNLSKSNVHVVVGQGTVRFLDDIGRLASTSCWEGDSLRFDAKLEGSGLAVTLLMYYNSAGNFVEEMVSCKGTVAKYIFDRRK